MIHRRSFKCPGISISRSKKWTIGTAPWLHFASLSVRDSEMPMRVEKICRRKAIAGTPASSPGQARSRASR